MSNYIQKDLVHPADFVSRHCGFSESDREKVLEELGFSSLEEFGKAVIPTDIYSAQAPELGKIFTEREVLEYLKKFAKQNTVATSMIGLGYYSTETPPVIVRNLLESTAWYTAYTPYQAEVSQGRLEMLLNFQTMLSDLTGLPLSGASLLDEATAAAEAMTLLHRTHKNNNTFFVDETVFPQTLALLQSRALPLGIDLVVAKPKDFLAQGDAFGCIIAYPAGDGELYDYTDLVSKLKAKNIFCACITDLLALILLKPPGEMGFDLAVGSSQRFGVPMGFGGPHAGFISFLEKFQRQVPGRVVGVSKDTKQRIGYRLALQTREQHIRREKATSNICTAQALPAMISVAYAIYHGPRRLAIIANRVHKLAVVLRTGLLELGFVVLSNNFFDTLRVRVESAKKIINLLQKENINIFGVDSQTVSITTDELTKLADLEKLLRVFASSKNMQVNNFDKIHQNNRVNIAVSLLRKNKPLSHAVFNSYHTEHEMLRYLRKLSDKDIALNRSMIPLGSCTMKLNATTEMTPISWPEFANIHPFAPQEQVKGYLGVLQELCNLLIKITGFHSVSLQPNAGAQGELAGLCAIRSYFQSKGQGKRDICLIPSSAHGTNPASAIMAGMKVVSIEVDKKGRVSLDDLQTKADKYQDNLAAFMLTYPSTRGVFCESTKAMCDVIHRAGGQVYMDGANLNALVGIVYPGEIGPDVMHINLHKTFCIPHGGGGPGMGPIGVKKHLAPFIPNHPFSYQKDYLGSNRTISAAPFGSGLILLISWTYIRLMGGSGLRHATLNALLSANYVAKKLAKKFSILYKEENGFVAHECILDTRIYKKLTGITVEDVAKRLVDFGYHAPTISWPVAGTMMIEPTESESKAELDKFCDTLLAIHAEIMSIEKGKFSKEDNPLINAPHTAEDLLVAKWQHSYTREQAAFPIKWLRQNKYWPPVSRIDSAWGDRNLLCSCLPMEAYEA